MSKVHALEQLGFEPQVDFRLYDNIDGNGQQMEWLSSDPQPSDAEIATAQTAFDAKAYARTRVHTHQYKILWKHIQKKKLVVSLLNGMHM